MGNGHYTLANKSYESVGGCSTSWPWHQGRGYPRLFESYDP